MLKFFKKKSKNKVLKYTEYKKQQALWLQIQNEKRTNRGTNAEQFCINCYLSYLNLIGFINEKIYNKIISYREKIGTYYLDEVDEKKYDKKIAENINQLMDDLI